MQSSKINTALLVILVVLVAIGLWFLMTKKDTANTKDDTTKVSEVSSTNSQNTTPANTTQNTTTSPVKKQYTGQGVRFSYAANASTSVGLSAAGAPISVGVGTNDPYTETIVFSDLPVSTSNYQKMSSEQYGTNSFTVYVATESGTKMYVLNSGRGNIIVYIPFRTGGNDTTKYIDLATVSFN